MALDSNTLLDEAKCYACYGPLTMAQLFTLAIERRILLAQSPSADVSAQGLMDYAKCYACYGASAFELLEFALLDQISQT